MAGSQVGSRLSFFVDQWKAIGASEAVCDLVKRIHLEFESPPTLMHPRSAPIQVRESPPTNLWL